MGQKCAPLELKVLGVLRVLGRGYCFDGIEELSYIIAEATNLPTNTSPFIAILPRHLKRSQKQWLFMIDLDFPDA